MARRGENIYKRKDGRWEGRCRAANSKYRSVYGKTYQEVKQKLTTLKASQETTVSSGRLTFGEICAEWFSAVKLRVKESTLANYRMKAERHILPEFGVMRYEMLTAAAVHEFIAKKLNAGLSAKYICDIVAVLRSVTRYAAKVHGFTDKLADLTLPRVQKKETKILDVRQQETLCRYLRQHMDRTALCILLSLYTGLRIGEVCGVMWSDIDLEKRTLTVRRTVQRIAVQGGGTRLVIGTPKSLTSRRTIPLPPFMAELLKSRRAEGYVLTGKDKPAEPRTLQERFRRILRKIGLPKVNFHSLRHAFATNCVRAGFDVKTLSEILGHANVTTTLNRYVHSSMEQKIRCMELLRPAG